MGRFGEDEDMWSLQFPSRNIEDAIRCTRLESGKEA